MTYLGFSRKRDGKKNRLIKKPITFQTLCQALTNVISFNLHNNFKRSYLYHLQFIDGGIEDLRGDFP